MFQTLTGNPFLSYSSLWSASAVIYSIMTKEEEIPDWVGAQEFYDKYEPKEILGRWVRKILNNSSVGSNGSSHIYLSTNKILKHAVSKSYLFWDNVLKRIML